MENERKTPNFTVIIDYATVPCYTVTIEPYPDDILKQDTAEATCWAAFKLLVESQRGTVTMYNKMGRIQDGYQYEFNPYKNGYDALDIDYLLDTVRDTATEIHLKDVSFAGVIQDVNFMVIARYHGPEWPYPQTHKPYETEVNLQDELYEATITQTPEEHQQFRAIQDELYEVFKVKNHDYGNSVVKSFNEYEEYGEGEGLKYCVGRLGDKMRRIKEAAYKKDLKVKDETVQDTLKDLANYCVLTLMALGYQPQEKK